MDTALNVLIVSASSMGNVGDNIVSLVNEGLARRASSNARIRHAKLNKEPLKDIAWADLVIVGGGGILYDWSIDNVDNYTHYIDLAKYAGKTVIASGVGVQGIHTEYGMRRYRETLNTLDCLIVRDNKDADALATIGVTTPIQILPDLAILLPELLPLLQQAHEYSVPEKIQRIVQLKSEEDAKPVLGVSLSSENASLNKDVDEEERDRRDALDEAKISLLKRLESLYTVVLMAHSRDDVELYEKAKAQLANPVYIEPLEQAEVLGVLDAYRCFDAVITSRYHGFLLGALTRRPMMVLTGENTAKIEKTIDSQLPVYRNNLVDIHALSNVTESTFAEGIKFSEEHDRQVNRLIDSVNKYHSYVGAVISKIGSV